jgi:hypothetical protein
MVPAAGVLGEFGGHGLGGCEAASTVNKDLSAPVMNRLARGGPRTCYSSDVNAVVPTLSSSLVSCAALVGYSSRSLSIMLNVTRPAAHEESKTPCERGNQFIVDADGFGASAIWAIGFLGDDATYHNHDGDLSKHGPAKDDDHDYHGELDLGALDADVEAESDVLEVSYHGNSRGSFRLRWDKESMAEGDEEHQRTATPIAARDGDAITRWFTVHAVLMLASFFGLSGLAVGVMTLRNPLSFARRRELHATLQLAAHVTALVGVAAALWAITARDGKARFTWSTHAVGGAALLFVALAGQRILVELSAMRVHRILGPCILLAASVQAATGFILVDRSTVGAAVGLAIIAYFKVGTPYLVRHLS